MKRNEREAIARQVENPSFAVGMARRSLERIAQLVVVIQREAQEAEAQLVDCQKALMGRPGYSWQHDDMKTGTFGRYKEKADDQ